MQVDFLVSRWGRCITFGSCRGMSSREVIRCFDKLGARRRIEWESLSDEIRERRRRCCTSLDELRNLHQVEESTNKISCHAVAGCV